MTTDLLVTQVRSSIGAKPKHRGTLRALGLGRIGKSNTLPDRPEIRGMIAKVPHLISVEEQAAETKAEAPVKKKTTAKKPAAKAAKKTTAKKAAKAAPAKAVAKRAPTGRGGERAEGGAAAGGASTEAKKQPAKATGATKKSATEQES